MSDSTKLLCTVCDEPGTLQCGACASTRFCSQRCQRLMAQGLYGASRLSLSETLALAEMHRGSSLEAVDAADMPEEVRARFKGAGHTGREREEQVQRLQSVVGRQTRQF